MGRFAPSPTGPLHFGSLVAAVASYAQAKSQGGRWLLRIEDIDPPREVAGASDEILRALEHYGFEWDGEVCYQSRRHLAYEAALEQLYQHRWVYPCRCSRKMVRQLSERGIYPGTCRHAAPAEAGSFPFQGYAMRVLSAGPVRSFRDVVQGDVSEDLQREVGDFVVRRADGLWAYQLAIVVDDAEQGVTEVVRGADLLASTARQIHLQHLLGYPSPSYFHLPVVMGDNGEKLSKQGGAPALTAGDSLPVLIRALGFLNQPLFGLESAADLQQFWLEVFKRWQADRVPSLPSCRPRI
ncbi:MAG: tRNA glutamyl-Q(34) synthetase GluQRS [Gammaproteobacteria bacterium]|nr:tRNA glutamyl-Q(34) synthetase GluQRS [Gammaproteobacteria bacterium]